MHAFISKTVLLLSILCYYSAVWAQVAAVRVNVYVPATEKPDTIYIGGSFNYWHSHDSLYRLKKAGDEQYTLTLPLFAGMKYAYKYTRGSWDEVETAANDSDIHNRTFIAENGVVISDTVAHWKQAQSSKPPTLQQQRFNSMKDSAAAELKPVLGNMQNILEQYVQNLLKEKPGKHIQKRLDKKMEKQLGKLYNGISSLIRNAMAMLTPQQKQTIRELLQHSPKKDDFFNNFQGALNQTISK